MRFHVWECACNVDARFFARGNCYSELECLKKNPDTRGPTFRPSVSSIENLYESDLNEQLTTVVLGGVVGSFQAPFAGQQGESAYASTLILAH